MCFFGGDTSWCHRDSDNQADCSLGVTRGLPDVSISWLGKWRPSVEGLVGNQEREWRVAPESVLDIPASLILLGRIG